MEKIVRESILESFREKAHKALSQTKADPELSIYHYFGEKGNMNMLRALRSFLKRTLGGMKPFEAFEEACDINGVVELADLEELQDTIRKMFDVDIDRESGLPF
jgi:hypothetical protein